ncbi:MAG: putative ABC transporter permease [Clostridia bacterium]|nr:putative ABC transporter permease [Clostridia bacterium]
MLEYSILDYIFYFFFFSFIGWFFESCYCSLRPKKWINRGFMRGPICPIYGTGGLVMLIALVPLRDLTENLYINELVIFVAGAILCDVVEFMTSYIMEKLFNARWWDYSNKKFNIQGRICLTHTLYWGTCSCLFVFILEPVMNLYLVGQVSESSRNILTYIFLTVFAFDLLDTVIHALGIRSFSKTFMKLSEEISEFAIQVYTTVGGKSENETEALKKELNDKFNDLNTRYESFKEDFKNLKGKSKKRLFKAFPFLKDGMAKQDKLIEDLLLDLKEKITNYLK